MDFKYDPESDVMAVTLIKNPEIAYAEELGDVVVHFNHKDKPVYLEILNSKTFFKQAVGNLPKRDLTQFFPPELTLSKSKSSSVTS